MIFCSVCKHSIEDSEYVLNASLNIAYRTPNGGTARKMINKKSEQVPPELGTPGADQMAYHTECFKAEIEKIGFIEPEGPTIRPKITGNY